MIIAASTSIFIQRCCKSPESSLYIDTRLHLFRFDRLRLPEIHSAVLYSVDARHVGSFHTVIKAVMITTP